MSKKQNEEPDTIPLEEFLEEVGITEEEYYASVEQGLRDFKEGRTISHEQLKRECGLD